MEALLGMLVAMLLAALPESGAGAGPGAPAPAQVTFSTGFEGGSLGRVEPLGEDRYRLRVAGQQDARGRNRQSTWYFFRMDGVRGRALTLTLTDLVGEYNDRPGAVSMNADTYPVFSTDGRTWRHVPAMEWDDARKEATFRLRPETDSLWVAHSPPYTPRHLAALLETVAGSPHARVEVIGRSVRGRDLHLVTVTDETVPDAGKRSLWLQARQHAWESGTSWVMEGALRFLTSDDPEARELRRRAVFQFLPMGDPDGSAAGAVRFNAHGYDVNRHWDRVDLRRKEYLERMPEIWYPKRALFAAVDSGRPIDLLVNLHNTETAEYVDAETDDPAFRALVTRLHAGLAARTRFDPSRPPAWDGGLGAMTALFREKGIPVVLMELRIGTSPRLGRRPTVEDRLAFGRELLREMTAAVTTAPAARR